MAKRQHNIAIAIDPGVKTGIAISRLYNGKWEWHDLSTSSILQAIETVRMNEDAQTIIIIEDASLVKFKTDRFKAQGAGSIKRDVSIWKEFASTLKGPEVEFVRPLTGIAGKLYRKCSHEMLVSNCKLPDNMKSSQHARDAAGILWVHWLSDRMK